MKLKEIIELHAFDIERGLLYWSLTRKCSLAEAAKQSFERIRALTCPDPAFKTGCPAFLCTGFRSGVEGDAGRKACFSMMSSLWTLGYMPYPLLGSYERPKFESALLIFATQFGKITSPTSLGWSGFVMFLRELMVAFQQPAVVLTLQDNPDAFLLSAGGDLKDRGPWSVDRLGELYSAVRCGLDLPAAVDGTAFEFFATDPVDSLSFRRAVDAYLRAALKDGTLDPEADVERVFADLNESGVRA